MKKTTALALCIICIALFVACSNRAAKQDEEKNVQIPNPFTYCETLDDAATISGFDLAVPESIDGCERQSIQAIENTMVQVDYENGGNSITVRKAVGTEDISGDYNQYTETKETAVADMTVTMKGSGGMVNVATWTNDGYAYAIDAFADGLTAEAVTALIQSIN